ncbi:phage tail tube protein [Sporosarcina sp. P17b]|uniref:phage tail tube protein n=1 Tax=Sporosarcina sp. P17b TaxID=2048260 RepID=UPI000C166F3E|nr:phage tail tube protein [Sporosarcina sp. P17b]PIC72431.1 terminase [Sporosarcina sp. P17b]
MTVLEGRRVLNGKHAKLWWDGELIFEVESFESKIVANREEVSVGASMDIDSKLISLTGEGSMTLKKVYSRGIKKLLQAWNEGKDPRSTLTGLNDDPDATGGQKERITINNVWFNEIILLSFARGEMGEREYPFGYTASSVDIQETIE